MREMKVVPVAERNNFTVRFAPSLYKRVKALAHAEDKSMQTVVDDATYCYIDLKEKGKLEHPDLGVLTKDERLLVKTALHMYRNAESTDREILQAIMNWWRRKWQ